LSYLPGPEACSPGKTQEGEKMPGPGLWVQEELRPWYRPSSISNTPHYKRKFFSSEGYRIMRYRLETLIKIKIIK